MHTISIQNFAVIKEQFNFSCRPITFSN